MAYASKYYDPQKAHEYYMKNRELKGYEDRYGGSRGDGTSYASSGKIYNKKTKKEESAAKIKQHNSNIDKQIRSANSNAITNDLKRKIDANKADIQDRINKCNSSIRNLRSEYNNLSKEEKRARKDEFQDNIEKYRQQIKYLRRDQQDYKASLQDQIHYAKLAQKDKIQELKMQKKGGSTSGFNQKGMEAAAYIKNQMEKERDELIDKINKEVDNKMLDKAKRFADDVKRMRDSGAGFNNKQVLAKLRALSGDAKKAKDKSKRTQTAEYKQKYKDEIDKLRQDKSMYTYYDKRAESESAYKERQAIRKSNTADRRKYQDKEYEERMRRRGKNISSGNELNVEY